MLGEATLDALFGSRLAVSAAFNRFSASSLAKRSFSCIANAAFWGRDQSLRYEEGTSGTHADGDIEHWPDDLHANGNGYAILLTQLRERRYDLMSIIFW